MAQRLVTPEDLEKNPDLRSRGIAANQMYDFGDEGTSTPDTKAAEPQKVEPMKTEQSVEAESNRRASPGTTTGTTSGTASGTTTGTDGKSSGGVNQAAAKTAPAKTDSKK